MTIKTYRIDELETEIKVCIISVPLDVGSSFLGAAAREIAGPEPDAFMGEFIRMMDNPRPLYQSMQEEGFDEADIKGMFAAMVTAHCDYARGIRPPGIDESVDRLNDMARKNTPPFHNKR